MTRQIVPPDIKAARGTERRDRMVISLYSEHASRPDPEVIDPPKGMRPAARKLWKSKCDRYRQRGQKIDGFQDALRQYCELEVELTEAWKRGTATMAMVAAHRMWCGEFYDTPASQKVVVGKGAAENPFAKNGKVANDTRQSG